MSELPITVPQALHDAVSTECGEDFAVSYLCGADIQGDVLHPRTQIARLRLTQSSAALHAIHSQNLKVGRAVPADERAPIPAVQEWRKEHPNHNWMKGR